MCGIVFIIQEITSPHFDLKPPFWGHHTQYIRHRVHCICVITPALSMISQPLYVWYHIKYICDILSTIFMTSYPLYMQQNTLSWLHHTRYMYDIFCATEDVTSTLSHQATIFMTSHPLQIWHHTPVSDIAPTVSLSTQPLHWYHTHFCMTSHPLCVWHHVHYI